MFLVEYCQEDRIFDCKNGYHEFNSEVVDSDTISECLDWVCDERVFIETLSILTGCDSLEEGE